MLKKLAIVAAVLVLPALVIAGGEIGKDHWTYKDIKSLIDEGVITKPLVSETLTRGEVVEYINNGVHNVLYAQKDDLPSGGNLNAQIDKLYNLVKAYMTDMARTEKKLDDILETIGDLRVKKAEVEKKQDRLLNLMGMRINGESSAYMTDVLLFGEPLPHAMRYRPITQYIDLMFSLNANKQVYAEATFRLLNLFGGFWGSFDVYGLKRFFIQGEYPIAFIVGDYQGKLTPLTLWAVEDERPFEAKVFKDRRDMNKKELYLIDNSWPLSGGKIHTIVELFDVVDLDIQVLGARLHEFHQASKPSYRTERIAGNVYNDEVQNKHDQYMIGGRVSSDFALNKIAPEIFTAKIGFNYNEIIDAKDTGDYNAPVVNNYVGSADLELAFLKNMIKLYGEAAMSWYTNNKWVINYEPGMAVVGGLELNAFNTKLKGSFRSVDWFYTAYAAQTRIYNEADNYLYITQNSTWNIGEKPPRYYIGGTEYPFTKYFNRINVSYNGIAGAGNLLGFPIYENSASPFGDATPDREGFGVELSGSYLDGMIEPLVIFESLAQLEDAGRDFLVVGGGLKLNIWQIKAYGGYKMESIAGTKNTEVAFDSSVIDAGLEYEIIRRKLTAHAGFKNNVFAGKEFWVGNGVTGGIQEFDMNVTAIGGGLEYRIAKPAVVGISFSNTIVENVRVPKNTFTVQELDVRVSINF